MIFAKASSATYRRFGSPSTTSMARSLLTQSRATSSPSVVPPAASMMPPWMMPLMHSYSNDIAGVVLIMLVRGGKSFLTSLGSRGVRVEKSLMILMAIQLLPPAVKSSKSRGARGRKSCGRRQPNSQTTFTIALVTDASSDSSSKRSLIFGQAGRSVSGYTSARR